MTSFAGGLGTYRPCVSTNRPKRRTTAPPAAATPTAATNVAAPPRKERRHVGECVLATVVATDSPAPKARTNRPDPVGPNFERKTPAVRPPTPMKSGFPSQRSTAQPRGFHICGARMRRPITSKKVVRMSHAGRSAGRDDHRTAGTTMPTARSETGAALQIAAAAQEPRTPFRSSTRASSFFDASPNTCRRGARIAVPEGAGPGQLLSFACVGASSCE